MKRSLELGVGLFLLLGFVCATVLALASTNLGQALRGDTYDITARFSNIGELKVGAPVKMAGVKIGEVSAMTLDTERFEAVATLTLEKNAAELPLDSAASIYTAGLLGDRYVAVAPGGDLQTLQAGDEIIYTQSAVVLEQLIGKYMFGDGAGKSSDTANAQPAPAPTP